MSKRPNGPRTRYVCITQVQTRSAPGRLRIKSLFVRHQGATSPRECAQAAADIVHALRNQFPPQWLVEGGAAFNFELARIVDAFESITPLADPEDPPHQALDDLNEQVATLLDWAEDVGMVISL